MKNLIIIILLCVAGYKLYDYKTTQSAMGGSDIVLFVFDECGQPCDDGLNLLKEKNVSFEAVNLSSGEEAVKRLRKLGGGNSMPVLFVGERQVAGFHRQRFNEALAELQGGSVLDAADREVLKTHFDSNGEPMLVMYGTSWCPYCKKARTWLQDNDIPFKEWDVEKQQTGGRYYRQVKSGGYPLIYVGYRRVEGFNERLIRDALDSEQVL